MRVNARQIQYKTIHNHANDGFIVSLITINFIKTTIKTI